MPRQSILAAALLAVLSLAGCQKTPEPPAQPSSQTVEQTPPARPPLLPAPVIDRAAFLAGLDAAASAYAAGRPTEGESLVGRSFVLRQAFGCAGAAPAGTNMTPGLAGVVWGPRQQSLELALQPADWTTSPLIGGEADWEVVEGFWVTKPWLREEACPAQPSAPAAGADAAAPSLPTAGLASVYPQGGSRLERRDGRAYRFTVRGEAPLRPPSDGYRLVIEGRFAAFPDGRAVRCHAPGPEVRPVCAAAAEVDRIAFEDAGGALLSEWRKG